ncbi:hypothetical protein [Mesorhizobium amorphae]
MAPEATIFSPADQPVATAAIAMPISVAGAGTTLPAVEQTAANRFAATGYSRIWLRELVFTENATVACLTDNVFGTGGGRRFLQSCIGAVSSRNSILIALTCVHFNLER